MSEDEANEMFHPNRPRRKFTKEQQMLGMWADDSDEEEELSKLPTRGFSKGPKNYTAPVNFVAGGIQQAGKPSEDKKKDKDKNNEEDDDDQDVSNTSSDSEEEAPPRPSFSINADAVGGIAGLRKKRAPVNPSLMRTGVGNWEVHTKGIGAKLLLQMGFEPGKGLGKSLQGISAPVEAQVRRGRGAIGAYGPEKLAKVPQEKKDEDAEKTKEFKAKLSQWRKTDGVPSKKKTKYSYKSIDQVLEDGKLRPSINTSSSDMSRVKVIDMTGPEQRVLSGYHAIAGQHRPDDSSVETDKKSLANFELPELKHNLNLIVDMCEQDIIQNDRKTRHLSDRLVDLEAELKTMAKIIDQDDQTINTLNRATAIVENLVINDKDMSLEETAEGFKKLQDDYYDVYKTYELGELASSLVAPKFKSCLASWSPLLEPIRYLKEMKEWKDILSIGNNVIQARTSMSPYDQLIWNAWMPSVRGAVQQWTCRQPDPLIELIENWMHLIPSWIMDNILEILVLNKLTLEVEEWNPLTDTVPIHTWIHPWLPLMGNRMDTLIYPIIRRKLGSALGGWHPSDRSARLMLEPWSQVFTKGDMEAFLVKNILPKLQIALSEFIINPHSQHLDNWNWVYDWVAMLPVHTMVGLLDKFFFPKWLQVLALWLNHSPNYDQITHWYMGWKKMLNDRLLAEPVIKDHFKKALDMMNRAVSTPQGLQPGAVEQVSYLTSLERTQPVPQIPASAQPRIERLAEAVRTASQIPLGFKDLVQKKCEERGILFMPMANRYREAKQVYKVGNVQAYIDGSVLFVNHKTSNWVPTHLNALLDMAEL
ncbi:tuftelin-interacting protein 11-like [Microplitis mediator]|uniref:tuftelin-interacting protein 11-like n=1 Tax=Microplitis mediator TaxID=375433 RepID=UPI002555D59A|nr:tuftelin-interacting protein 11-like [Microplitis mediator]